MLNPEVESITCHSNAVHEILNQNQTSTILDDNNISTFDFDFDMVNLRRVVEFVRQKIVESLDETNLQLKREDLRKLILAKCLEVLSTKVIITVYNSITFLYYLFSSNISMRQINLLKLLTLKKHLNPRISLLTKPRMDAMLDSSVKSEVSCNDALNESEWEERRFLSLLSHQKTAQTRSTSNIMTKSGEFVVMEAKELLKLFEDDGSAKKGTVLQPLPVQASIKVNNYSYYVRM